MHLDNKIITCKKILGDNFEPPFKKPQDSPPSCNAIVATALILCSQHVTLAMQVDFPF